MGIISGQGGFRISLKSFPGTPMNAVGNVVPSTGDPGQAKIDGRSPVRHPQLELTGSIQTDKEKPNVTGCPE
jgi:hypothetical protein